MSEPKKKKPTWLKGLRLGEVSLVGVGANQHAKVDIWKSADGLPNDTQEGLQMADRTEVEKAMDEVAKANTSIARLEGEVTALNKQLADGAADLRARDRDLADVRAAHTLEVEKHADPEEVILKGMSEPQKAAFLAQKETNAKLLKRLEKDDTEKALGLIAKSFDADMSGLPIKGDDAAPIIQKAVEALDDEQMDELNRILKAGSDALKELEIVKGLTNGGKAPTSAEDTLDKMAKELAAKDNVTFEKAYSKVITANPELYSAFDAERGFTN